MVRLGLLCIAVVCAVLLLMCVLYCLLCVNVYTCVCMWCARASLHYLILCSYLAELPLELIATAPLINAP